MVNDSLPPLSAAHLMDEKLMAHYKRQGTRATVLRASPDVVARLEQDCAPVTLDCMLRTMGMELETASGYAILEVH
jgi:hypothetical protein